MRALVGLGDLLRAWDATGRDPELLAPLARTFGLEPGAVTETTTEATARRDRSLPRTRSEKKAPDADPIAAELSVAGRVTRLEPLTPAPPSPPPAWIAEHGLEAPAPEHLKEPEPMFEPRRERALLSAICRTRRPEGRIDVPRLVAHMSRLHVPRVLPRLLVPSLAGGLQLIVDVSPWMAPFDADVTRLIARLRDVTGELTDLLSIPKLPPYTRHGDDESVEWTPPRAGTAVVIVSDLGRAALLQRKRAPRAAWIAFVTTIRAAGFSPLIVVPGQKTSYPDVDRQLRHTLLLGWDRRARVAEAANFRKGRGR
jgi:hypothetical protein